MRRSNRQLRRGNVRSLVSTGTGAGPDIVQRGLSSDSSITTVVGNRLCLDRASRAVFDGLQGAGPSGHHALQLWSNGQKPQVEPFKHLQHVSVAGNQAQGLQKRNLAPHGGEGRRAR